jgi:2-polyprenyl-3-methyl-5-hydroxy-6-metoxy-1,4-benzoquinol methylase
MDLREVGREGQKRHPWELARATTIARILAAALPRLAGAQVLDLGCGDGFLVETLRHELPQDWKYTALDPELSEADLVQLQADLPEVTCLHDQCDLEDKRFDLILLLDVLEHVEQDQEFLTELVNHRLKSAGKMLLTAPAFQVLFSGHDRFLKHHRRYSLTQLRQVAANAGLAVESSGYLFGSLLLPRSLSRIAQALGLKSENHQGVGGWKHGQVLSKPLEWALNLDNRLMLSLSKLGLTLPGLTTWALCGTRPNA